MATEEKTDWQALLDLLDRFGLTPIVAVPCITLEAKIGGVEGYAGFYAEFTFDHDGKFTMLFLGVPITATGKVYGMSWGHRVDLESG